MVAPQPPAGPAELRPDQLRWCCGVDGPTEPDPGAVPNLGEIMGQERALSALKMGLELYAPGYNIFVCGIAGTGRTSTVKRILENIAPACALAPDRAYVHNFGEPDRPRLLTLPRGVARFFRDAMTDLVAYLRRTIPAIFEDDAYKQQRDAVVERFAREERTLVQSLSKRVQADGLALAQVQIGPVSAPEVLPLRDGQPVPIEQVEGEVAAGKLPAAEFEALTAKIETYRKELAQYVTRGRELARAMGEEVEALGRRLVRAVVGPAVGDIRKKFDHPGVGDYLREVEEDILESVERFRPSPDPRDRRRVSDRLLEYQVNIVQDQFGRKGCPVVVEPVPSFTNLFGVIERQVGPRGAAPATHMDLRAGALVQADGGYLVVNALDAFLEPGVWITLKRTLKSGQLQIRPPDAVFAFGSPGLRPEPMPMNVKVVMIGDTRLYHLVAEVEEDFRRIFKILAEFESEVPRTPENLRRFASVTAQIAEANKCAPLAREGVAAVTEFAVRRAGRQHKLSVRFSEVADVIREADYWRRQDGDAPQVAGAHVVRALAELRRRHGITEERLREMIAEGVLRVEVTGGAVGQVNGLAVYDFGVYAFGKPSRITATAGPGRAGVINIEREAQLSGTSHDKGMLILAGFMRQRFAQRAPLALTASVCFEQSYGGVDGDSASSTEIYALLSSLAGLPIRQTLAVTGSVDQFGTVQAIGGVNEKIEGFFEVCQARGLTGDQGVLIPPSNVADLMLRPDVVEAVQARRFHIWPVATIDEGISILTGVGAGVRAGDGQWTPGSVNARVQARLDAFAASVREFDGRAP